MRSVILLCVIYCTQPLVAQDKESSLLKHLEVLSADDMQGREFGKNTTAQQYIIEQFENLDLPPAFKDGYKQPFSHKDKSGNNIVATLKGESDKVIIVTAHFDHLGSKDGEIFNGADDNASGTVALFAIGDYLKKHPAKHTIMLAAVDAEEIGSVGAQYLIDNFPYPIEKIALNINLDMIAHNDANELYACGTYFYPQLKAPLENLNSEIDIKFGHDSPAYKGADNWTFASDHRVFHRKKIPFIYFGVEDHKDYHQPSDTYENINEGFYLTAIDLIIDAIEAYDAVDNL